ncbi:type II toxin-antitoxin system VapC family toxin [Salmonella enterica subsp. houtenae]|nr:type II toxin-antitoxin system VapC family toxin [Salmonella enterica subsp. enterica serovar Rissen]EEJ6876184.1 type II toxin-antitoxin system VapC family toxin [Salmonella enterica subsp. houtenae]EIO1438417.1 type II toxin-antitoxin system VapC family toxin [Salmonella enterica]
MYMLDTNTVSHFFRQNAKVVAKFHDIPPSRICISSLTEAELRYGIAKRKSKSLTELVEAFLETVKIMAWDSQAAERYGILRADMERSGRVMGTLDQLIAAHAGSSGMIIVTNDAAFSMVPGLLIEDWTK